MRFEAIALFLAVCGRGGFAAAATARGVDATAASRAVAGLERELGVRLFHRTTRRVALTEDGRRFQARAEAIMAEWTAARLEAQQSSAAPRGRLRMSCSTAFAVRVVAPLLPAFHTAYPEVAVELKATDARLDLVAEAIDLAIRHGGANADSGLGVDAAIAKLAPVRYRLCASPASLTAAPPLTTPADLPDHQCVLPADAGWRGPWRFRTAGGVETMVPIDGGVWIDSPLAQCAAAAAGGGPALLADWLAAPDLKSGALIDVFPDYRVAALDFDAALWTVRPRAGPAPAKVAAMLAFLSERVG